VEQSQLGRAGLELQEAQRGAETTAARGLVPPALPGDLSQNLQRAPKHGLHSGDASRPQVVDVMERIESWTRTQGSRKG
jgi:hypothetical protein